MPKGGNNITSSVERFTEKLLSLKGKLEAKRLEYIEERIKMEDFLATIEDSEISLIARMRFIDNRSWEYIGKEMNMDRTTVSKKLSKYLKYHNADYHNNQQKTGSAPLVLSGTGHDIFYRQIHSVFHTVDTFMLCTVVHKCSLNIFHSGNQKHISQEKRKLHECFGYCYTKLRDSNLTKQTGQCIR